jgi:hypothetical protein
LLTSNRRANDSWAADAKMTDLLPTLANCPKARSVSIRDRCMARYEAALAVALGVRWRLCENS